MKPNIFGLILLVPALVCAGVALCTWGRRSMPGARILLFLMSGTSVAAFAYGMEIMSSGLPDKLLWVQIRYLGTTCLVSPMYLLLALWHTNRQRWLTTRGVAVLFVLPVFSLVGVLTNDLHHLHYAAIGLDLGGPFPMLTKAAGPLYWFYSIHAFFYMVLALGMLWQAYLRAPLLVHRQTTMLIVGTAVPVAAAALYLGGIRPFGELNILPFAYTFSGLAFAWAILRWQLLDLGPMAHGRIFESMTDGVLVLNNQHGLVDANPAARRLLGLATESIGQPAHQALADIPALVRLARAQGDARQQIELGEHTFDASRMPLLDNRDRVTGHLISLRDITDSKRIEEALRENEEKFRVLADSTPTAIMLYQDDRWIYANRAATAICGYSADELLGMYFWDFVHPDFRQAIQREGRKRQYGEETTNRHSFKIIAKDGAVKWVDLSGASTMLQGRLAGIVTVQDITDRKRAEKALRKSEEKFRLLVENSHDIIYSLTAAGVFVFVSPAWTTLLGHPATEVVGQSYESFVHPEDLPRFGAFLRSVIETGQRQKGVEYRVRHADGTWHWHASSAVPFQDETGAITGFYGIARDITERKRAEDALKESENRYRELSIVDDLTRLYNSRHFYNALKMELDRVERYGQTLTLLLLDLDNFKQINDTYGHIMGDQVLSQFGKIIKRHLRQTDSAYRYGGEEFTVLLPMTTSANGILTAERIRTEFAKATFSPAPGKHVSMTVSIGVAQYRPHEEMNAFVHRADQLMYQAKKNGKDQVCAET